MRNYNWFVAIILSFFSLGTTMVIAQSGDQILDGIGETDLIARYLFDGNAKDWSRNNLHATIQGANFEFVEDDIFGKVLSLSQDGEAFVSIPGESVIGQESLTIMGWIYMRSKKTGQQFFDFGSSESSHFFAYPLGNKDEEGFLAQIQTPFNKYNTISPAISVYKWNHLAIVIDIPTKTLRIFLNGVRVSELKNVELDLEKIFDSNSNINKLYVGKSLNAKLHDFRIYGIPLSEQQIAKIFDNSLKEEVTIVRTRNESDQDFPKFAVETPQLYNGYLISVPDILVETELGYLPRLPRYVKGIYKHINKGPDVRVLWPAPTDNSQVLKSGIYTIVGIVPGTTIQPKAIVKVAETKMTDTPNRKLEVFNLDQVFLNSDNLNTKTVFIEHRDKFLKGLANSNPDNFLYMFRNAYGQTQPDGAEPLKGWDSQETKLRGHATGHYLSAIAQAYASTSFDTTLQTNFAVKMEYMVNTLYELSQLSGMPLENGGDNVTDPNAVPPGADKQDFDSDLSEEGIRTDYWNWGKGFISAYPPDQFIMLENGASYGTGNDKIWAPYYTLHKILAGLLDVYEVSGNEKALEIVKSMGDWVYARLSQVPTKTRINMWNRYIAGEFGGMNESMAKLYRLTNEPRYLEAAQLFDNIKVFFGDAEHAHGLAKNVDMLRGLHANQHIPQFLGALEIYRVSNTPEYYHIADNFWDKATNDYMYSIGGVAGARNPSNAECFTSQPATLYENGFSEGGQNETCATYNMLKLTSNLFLFDQRAELMDYYERGLYNHILASVAEETPANTYHVSLKPGSLKRFGNANMNGFTCCNGTALESSTKLQNAIYFKSADNQSLYVNLYVPSTLNWKENNVTITQTTAFPKEDHTQLTITGNGTFDLNVRVPHWATKGFFVKINGKKQKVTAIPGSYFTINRNWKNGDKIELRMPFQFHLEPVMDQQNIASIFYGPILLAAQEKESLNEWRQIKLNAKDISKSITGDTEKLEFKIDGIDFKPFYATYGRYSVYMDVRLK